jgi:hypothetical protein
MPLDGVAVVAFGNEQSGCLPNAFLCEAGRYARVRAGPRDAALASGTVSLGGRFGLVYRIYQGGSGGGAGGLDASRVQGGTVRFSNAASTKGTLTLSEGRLGFSATVSAPAISGPDQFPYNGFALVVDGAACVDASAYTGVSFELAGDLRECILYLCGGQVLVFRLAPITSRASRSAAPAIAGSGSSTESPVNVCMPGSPRSPTSTMR